MANDYSKFDTSNIRVTKVLIHPIKVSCTHPRCLPHLVARVARAHLSKKQSTRCKASRCVNTIPDRMFAHLRQNDRKWCVIRADNRFVVTAREVPKVRR